MIFRSPAAADRDRRRFVKFENMGLDIGYGMRAVTKWRIFRPGAAAIGDAFRDLLHDRRFDEIVVGQGHLVLLGISKYLEILQAAGDHRDLIRSKISVRSAPVNG
jgi:hypothetical protein